MFCLYSFVLEGLQNLDFPIHCSTKNQKKIGMSIQFHVQGNQMLRGHVLPVLPNKQTHSFVNLDIAIARTNQNSFSHLLSLLFVTCVMWVF